MIMNNEHFKGLDRYLGGRIQEAQARIIDIFIVNSPSSRKMKKTTKKNKTASLHSFPSLTFFAFIIFGQINGLWAL